MKIIATSIVAILLLAGCSREPKVDVSGRWYFFSGGRLALEQDGRSLTGTGDLPTATSGSMPITVDGKVQGERILLTFNIGTNVLNDVEFLPAISPKGNQEFLKCPQYLSLTLIPEGVDFFKHEILKPELAALREKREGPQQPDGAVTQESAQSAAP